MVNNVEFENDVPNNWRSFRRNFQALYPRSPLIKLVALNELGQKKVLPSYITPSLIPDVKFLDLESAVITISNLITIKNKESPDSKTTTIKAKSPGRVAELQEASVLEATILLTSILCGCGYKALVVQGQAVKANVINNFAQKNCTYQPPSVQKKEVTQERAANKYQVKLPPKLESQFRRDDVGVSISAQDIYNEKNLKTNADTETELLQKFNEEDQKCLHFWVLILPPDRGIEIPLFVNVSDGKLYSVKDCQSIFTSVHAVFDHEDFYACRKFDLEVNKINYDLNNEETWFSFRKTAGQNEEFASYRWTSTIRIPEKVIRLEYPSGQWTEKYKDAIVNKFAPFIDNSGVVLSVKCLQDNEDQSDRDWVEFSLHENRKDFLSKKIQTKDGYIIEHFLKSRNDTLKVYKYKIKKKESKIEELSEEDLNFEKKFNEQYFEFYDTFRVDGLKSRHLFINIPRTKEKSVFKSKPKPTITKNRWKASLAIISKASDIDHSSLGVQDQDSSLQKLNFATLTGAKSPSFSKESFEEQEGNSILKSTAKGVTCNRGMPLGFMELIHRIGKEQVKRNKPSTQTTNERKVILKEIFSGRNDGLTSRTTKFVSIEGFFKCHKLSVNSLEEIEEEFDCLPSTIHPEKAIQKRIFNSVRQECVIHYHYGQDRLLRGSHTFEIPRDQKTSSLTQEMVHSFEPNPKGRVPTLEELRDILAEQLNQKAKINQEILKAVSEMKNISDQRTEEEQNVILTSGIFDYSHNPLLSDLVKKQQEKEANKFADEERRKQEIDGKIDIVDSYMPLLMDPANMNGKEQVKERCLEDLMKRLELRTNLLQDRLDNARSSILFYREELSGRRHRLTQEDRALLTEKAARVEMEHRRLRGFLATWRSEAAHRYEALEVALENDPRLN